MRRTRAEVYGEDAPLRDLEWTELIFRMEDLLRERHRAFMRACHPHAPGTDAEWRRLDKALEQTAIEFAAYAARLRLGAS